MATSMDHCTMLDTFPLITWINPEIIHILECSHNLCHAPCTTSIKKISNFAVNRYHSIKSKEIRVFTHTGICYSRHLSAGVGDHPCFLTFNTMIPIDCKIANCKIANFPY